MPDLFTGRLPGQPVPPPRDEVAEAQQYAGALALATATPPAARPAVGYNPRASAWAGTEDCPRQRQLAAERAAQEG